MHAKQRTLIAQLTLALLGIAMIVIGAMGPMAPPIITGVGFFVIALVDGRCTPGEQAMNIYLLMSDRPFDLDIGAEFPEHHLVWDHAVLIESEQSQSRVYHAIKHALPADTPLMIAILDQQPKFKGAKPGLLKWLRERYDAMPARY